MMKFVLKIKNPVEGEKIFKKKKKMSFNEIYTCHKLQQVQLELLDSNVFDTGLRNVQL